ncbi:LysR family transcriptional regulator [Actinoplanes couchii]|uniref:LysR family transcriptional regulator n=1 Tax=Actinoplanes couchii TaxID=403638 RepID=A0ABQ3XS19_9ACTN|nr:LysR family transcriptional regulator [Actinoplanes couchii]MDR6318737.1 DNA-binding transcriptional LysR family regulator [Actinoplanes couchii]GID61265.1 LysR family transcriptional regulator [Actinoplanes couchii]
MDIDLNLLRPLHALLTERNVTRAGHRVGVSQPAMSAALRRLRTHYGDPLLVRSGGELQLTRLGELLLHRTAEALAAAERVLTVQGDFDPGSSTRRFTVIASDYAVAVIGAALATSLRAAPGVTVEFRQHLDNADDDPETILRDNDLVILPRGHLDGFPSADLWQDRWVCLTGDDEPADLTTRRWVAAHHGSGIPLAPVARLSETGHHIRISVLAQSHLALPMILGSSGDLVALVQQRLADQLPQGTLTVRESPFLIPDLHEAMWWHPAHHDDAGNRWLRTLVAASAPALRR